MTRYLLDTDVLIDFSKGREPTTEILLSWIDGDDIVAVCPISVAEFYAGLSPDHAEQWHPFFASLPYWGISREAAIEAGRYRYTQARAGLRLTMTDALVAAVAVERTATLVTRNVRHFRLEQLSVLSLT